MMARECTSSTADSDRHPVSRRRAVRATGGAALLSLISARTVLGYGDADEGTPAAGTPDSATPGGGTPAAGSLSPAESVVAACRFIAGAIDASGGTDPPHLAQSYFGGPLGDDGFDVAFTYDNALAIMALLGRGDDESLARAKILAEGILLAQASDPAGDGRIRDGYTPAPFLTDDGSANIAFTFGQGGTSVGNMAWAAMALCHVAATTADAAERTRATGAAVALAGWVETNARSETGPGRLHAGHPG